MTAGASSEVRGSDVVRSRRHNIQRGAFYLISVLVVAMAIAFVGFLMQWGVEAWYSTEFGDHRIHQIVDGTIMAAIVLGVLIQLYRPSLRIAALQSSIALIVVFSVFGLAGGGPVEEIAPFLILITLLGVLHPSGREMIRPFTAGKFSPLLAGMALAASIPLAVFAYQQFGFQLDGMGGEHAEFGHWTTMAAYSVSIVVLGLLASLKTRMWMWPAAVAGIFATFHGLASILFETASGVGTMWGGLELLWGIVFLSIAVAKYAGMIGEQRIEPTGEVAEA